MLLIRRFEEKAGQSYGLGQIGGFCHLYIGQEAVVVGLQMCIRDGDQVITTYRDHGHMLACGMSPDGVMAELYGRTDGYSKGKGGSMHMFSKKQIFLVGTVLLVRPFHLELVWHFQTSTKKTKLLPLLILVMVQLTKVRCMKVLIWPNYGNSLVFM